ncbi:MAG: hypothetical protein EOO88_34050 [Pedobacter sp.]|nr:MAG: hypothetical protein EOO88_34050 [Pedobacter sp.]
MLKNYHLSVLSQTTSLLSLPNGCLCCSFKDMGIAAIEEMVASQKGVDWVMVELTGVADPGKPPYSSDFVYPSGLLRRKRRQADR